MSLSLTVAVTGQSLIHRDIRNCGDPAFLRIVDILKRADIAFTNFEGTILGRHGGSPMKGSYFGCSDPFVLDALKQSGFNALALANNHAFDLGSPGVLSTLEEVSARGFLHAGIGLDRDHASTPGKAIIKGRIIRLVAMDAGPGSRIMYAENAGFQRPSRPGINQLEVTRVFEADNAIFDMLETIQTTFESSKLERANYAQPDDSPVLNEQNEIDFYGTVFRRSDTNRRKIVIGLDSASHQLTAISKAATAGQFVIAYLHHHHWEPNWRDVPEWVVAFAHACIDAGARIFVSHGTPVLQPIEVYKGAPIFFGLGNFLFHTEHGDTEWSSPDIWKSVVATCHFDATGVQVDILPIVLGGEERLGRDDFHERRVPMAASEAIGDEILDDLAKRSAAFGTVIKRDGLLGRIHVG
ncbi:capsule biosynthesis protein CapA [Rhizobium lusitanum]|uniref:Capsule biosynthesis protein CapA n=1 Tax=Rhizobium lusitanum TaxID=293958 RepID=A0A6L9UM09_9HYPH|nr:CapA family protein [Rhizobium lusitanum]NEI74880.1 capsule biosynthesis protein CapA [Rhizobium lusitanum]